MAIDHTCALQLHPQQGATEMDRLRLRAEAQMSARYKKRWDKGMEERTPQMNGVVTRRSSNDAAVETSQHGRALTTFLVYGVAFVAAFAVMMFFVSQPRDGVVGVPGNDSFYHLKMSELLPDVGLVKTFPWLQFSYFRTEGDGFVSHHYGFHCLLYPFVAASKYLTGDALAGGRWAVSTFFAITVCIFLLILRKAKVPLAPLWLLLLLILPHQFFMRHGYVRAIGPALAMMMLLIYCLLRRRPVKLAMVAGLSNHLYLGAIMYTPVIVGAYAAASVLDRRETRKFPWLLVSAAAIGWGLGAITYPYFDGMVEFLKLQVFGTGLSPDIAVGREWKPYDGVWWFVTELCGPLLLVTMSVAVARFRLGPRLDVDELFLLFLNLGFLVLTLKARRFIEYWPMFALLSVALMSRPLFGTWWATAQEKVGRVKAAHRQRTLVTVGLSIWVIVFVGLAGYPRWLNVRQSSACKFDLPAIRATMDFVKANSQPEEVIFTTDWDDFPLFFYHNAQNYYVVGLDPKFTHERRPDLWERYVKLTRGRAPVTTSLKREDDSGKTFVDKLDIKLADIRSHFRADLVITDGDHTKLARQLARDKDLATLIYPESDYAKCREAPFLVFRIRPAKTGDSNPEVTSQSAS